MCHSSKSIDRRAEYYARCASVIAEDPLGFYARAERGRKYLESHRATFVAPPSPSLTSLFARAAKAAAEQVARESRALVPEYAYARGYLLGRDEE
jgi:hypothetical protein